MLIAMLLPLLLAIHLPVQEVEAPPGDEIVVRATKRKCRLAIANRILSDAEFQRRAAEWAAGRPVRVIVPAATDYKCLAKIMFRLNEHGVKRAAFIDAGSE